MMNLKLIGSKVFRRLRSIEMVVDLPIQYLILARRSTAMPPIIIIGPARSGTTLVYQLLATSPEFSYIDGFVADRPFAPALAALKNRKKGGEVGPFESNYGVSRNYAGPQQGHSLWGRWFRRGSGCSKLGILAVRRTVSVLSNVYKRPMVIKWPGFTAHVDDVARAWPDAFYVFVERDLLSNGRSLLFGNSKLLGDPNHFITRVPSSASLHSDDPAGNVVQYLLAAKREQDRLALMLKRGRSLVVTYEDVCRAPKENLERIHAEYFEFTGVSASIDTSIPDSFPVSVGPSLPGALEDQLQESLGSISPD